MLILVPGGPAFAQLNGSWTVMAGGQTAQVNPDGSFFIPNVTARDSRPPPGVSDDPIRVRGFSTANGATLFAYSTPFQLTTGERYLIDDLTITPTPPISLFVESLFVQVPSNILQVSSTMQLNVLGKLIDGQVVDATSAGDTIYRTSNPFIGTVSDSGLLTGSSPGTVFITATNGGATSTGRVRVFGSAVASTLTGFVQKADGTPVAGAVVTPVGLGTSTLSNADGFFSLPIVVGVGLAGPPSIPVLATATIDSEEYRGKTTTPVPVAPNGFTDAGVITIRPLFQGFIFANPLFPSGGIPVGIASGDLDGDGDNDLVAINQNTNNVSVFLNIDEGILGSSTQYAVGNNPNDIALAHLDSDTNLDLAVLNRLSQTVSVLRANGNGTFANQVTYSSGGVSATAMAITDLDKDTDNDIVVVKPGTCCSFADGALGVLLNNGDATFAPPVDYPVGAAASTVVAADLNGDTWPDIAVGRVYLKGSLATFFNNGDGTLAPPTAYNNVGNIRAIATADLDNDKDFDIAFTYAQSMSVMLNDGTGIFSPPNPYTLGPNSSFGSPNDIIAQDLDGDLDADLAVAMGSDFSGALIFFRNAGLGTFPAPEVVPGGYPNAFTVADFNSDGNPDLASSNVSGLTGVQHVVLHLNSGTASFGGPVLPLNISETELAWTLVVEDFNRDNLKDIAYTVFDGFCAGPHNVSILKNLGGNAFSAAETHTLLEWPESIASGDLNGDLYPELIVTESGICGLNAGRVSVLTNSLDGSFASPTGYQAGDWARHSVLADFDRQGGLDIATVNELSSSVSVLRNQGNGTFGTPTSYSWGMNFLKNMERADLDQDLYADLIAADDGGSLRILRNDQDGTFVLPPLSLSVCGSLFFAAGDVNGDLLPDLVAPCGTAIAVRINEGSGTFSPDFFYATSESIVDIRLEDLDLSGELDIVGASDRALLVCLNAGDGTFPTCSTYSISTGLRRFVLSDFDADGDLDLVVVSPQYQRFLQVFLNRVVP